MTDIQYDTVIRNGTIATATDVFKADLAISGEKIAAIGSNLPAGRRAIDAAGQLVLPGGVAVPRTAPDPAAAAAREWSFVEEEEAVSEEDEDLNTC